MATELATAYVNILPSTRGLGKSLVKEFGDAEKTAGRSADTMGGKLSDGLKRGVAVGLAGLGAAFAGVAAKGLAEFSSFEKGMNEVFTLLPGASEKAMGKLIDDARTFSKEMGVAHSEAVPALYSALSAGVPKDTVFDFLETANKAAIGGIADLDTAVSAISGPVNAYGEETLNANAASDAMFTAIKNGVTTFPELAGHLSDVTPVAASLGVNFGDVTAAVATMTAQGTKTGPAITGMRQALLELSKDGTKTSDTFKEVAGTSFKDFIAGGGNVQEALAMLAEHADSTGIGVNDLFGSVEAGTAALQLTGGNAEKFATQIDAAYDAMASGGAVTSAAFETMDQGLSRSWTKIKVGLTDAAIGFGQTLAPAVAFGADVLVDRLIPAIAEAGDILGRTLAPVITEITGGFRAFGAAWAANDGDVTSSGFPGFMERLGFVLRRLSDFLTGYVIPAFQAVGSWIVRNRGWIVPLVTVILSMVAAWKIAALVTVGYVAAAAKIAVAIKFIKSLRYILLAARIAMVMLNTAMRANVVGVIVTALVGLIVGLKMAYDRIGWFKTAVDATWAFIKRVIGGFVGWLTDTVWPGILDGLAWVGDKFAWLGGAAADAWGGIRAATAAVADWWTGTLVPALTGALDALGAAMGWLRDKVIKPIWSGIRFMVALYIGLVIGYFKLIKNALTFVLAPGFTWLRDKVIRPVMSGVRALIENVSEWFSGTAVPAIRGAVQTVGDKFTWFRDKVIRPVFDWVKSKIDDFLYWYVNVFGVAVRNAVQSVADKFTWFRDKVIRPVIDWVKSKLEAFWHWYVNVFGAAIRRGIQSIADKFTWFRDNVIRPVWDWIRDKITGAWDSIKSKAFDPLRKAITETIPAAFERGKDAVKKQWEKLRDIVSKPVGWVIDNVINEPLISSINSVLESVGLRDKKITPLPSTGFARGGWTGPGGKYDPAGVVHADEFVIRKESQRDISRTAPGLLDAMNRYGASALGYAWGGLVGKRFDALTARPSASSDPFLWGRFQERAKALGQLEISGRPPGAWGLDSAAAMWHNAAGIGVTRAHTFNAARAQQAHARETETLPFAGSPNWAGYWGGGNIYLRRSFRQSGTSLDALRAVSAHEIGHALGLGHAHRRDSLMNPTIGRGTYAPTAYDIAELQKLYPGGTGRAGKTGPLASVLALLGDKLSPITGLLANVGRWARDKFPGGGKAVDMALGAGKYVAGAAKDWLWDTLEKAGNWITGLFGGGDKGGAEAKVRGWITTALRMKGLATESNITSGVRRAMQESGGDPRAVNNWDINARNGDPSRGLMQTIGATFRQYMESGHGDIWNPIDNILASINYTIARYGSLRAGWDRAGGYADGGLVRPALYDRGGLIHKGVQVIDHQRRSPDRVLTDRQWNALYSTAEAVRAGDSGRPPVQVIVPERTGMTPDQFGRRIGDAAAWEMMKAGI